MKQIFVLLLIAVAGFCVYRFHHDQVKQAAEEARVAAETSAAAREAALRAQIRPAAPPAVALPSVAVSRQLEPLYVSLFGPLDSSNPVDLVPPLALTRERLLDRKGRVPPKLQEIYTLGANLVRLMIDVAEERTKVLESMVQVSAGNRGTLDTRSTVSSSTAFFAQNAQKRWDVERQKRKVTTDQVFAQLRDSERAWNAAVPPGGRAEGYDEVDMNPVLVMAENTGPINSLEKGGYNRSANFSARQRYYQQNGYTGASNR